MRTSLAALAMLLPTISGAPACDDYPEEMALAAARVEAKLAHLARAQPQSLANAAITPDRSLQAGVTAAGEGTPRQGQTTAALADAAGP